MSKFIKNLSMFVASLPVFIGRNDALAGPSPESANIDAQSYDPISLRPLNFDFENQYASHRSHSSHSSHRSHSSHYSGSSGTYTAPTYPQGAYSPPAGNSFVPSTPSSNYAPTAPAQTTGSTGQAITSDNRMVRQDGLANQIQRVQIALRQHGLYGGPISGTMNDELRAAIKEFQTLRGLSVTGRMDTETLNSLGLIASR